MEWTKGARHTRGKKSQFASYEWSSSTGYKLVPTRGGRYTATDPAGNQIGLMFTSAGAGKKACEEHAAAEKPEQKLVANVPPEDDGFDGPFGAGPRVAKAIEDAEKDN